MLCASCPSPLNYRDPQNLQAPTRSARITNRGAVLMIRNIQIAFEWVKYWLKCAILFFFGLVAIGIPLMVLMKQIMSYLHAGFWSSFSVIDALAWLGNAWALFPTDWLGAHKILAWMPFSALSFIGVVLTLYISESVSWTKPSKAD